MAIVNAGLVTSVGLSTEAACAAIRASIANHTETRFMGAEGEWILGAQVPLPTAWRGRAKLVKMLRLAIDECLASRTSGGSIPLLLCVAETDRPGRIEGLDDRLFSEIEQELGIVFHREYSGIVAEGRTGVAVALERARRLLFERSFPDVLIAASDSLLVGATLADLLSRRRLLTPRNSNGFVPGEAAGAILVSRDPGPGPHLRCTGLGFAREAASVDAEEPLRGDGLTQAIKLALADAGCEMHDLDFRITDNSGEQYYFKEASLALSRTLRRRKERFDIWHPAECVGEVGAASVFAVLAVALVACRKAYALGPNILFHCGTDDGRRAAGVLRYEETF